MGHFLAGSDDWWIDDEQNESRRGADRLNRLVAGDIDFEAVAVPLRSGVLIGRRIAAIRALEQPPQWLDHAAYGLAVGVWLRRARGA